MKINVSIGILFISTISLNPALRTQPLQESNTLAQAHRASWNNLKDEPFISFASADVRYEKEKMPSIPIQRTWRAKGWKGEKVHTQFVMASNTALRHVNFQASDLKDGNGNIISSKNVHISFMGYVLTDSLSQEGMGCGIEAGLDSSLVEDMIGHEKNADIPAYETQPVWLSVNIPHTLLAGTYKGTIKVAREKGAAALLNCELQVVNRTLPKPKDWKFHLDLWQNPFSISRHHKLRQWSPEHFAALKPYMKMLAAAGQKVITTSIIHDPWNSQTHDIYSSMIKWTKNKDGAWSFDYSVFDKWVSFMISLGIDREINCYSMIPWNHKFYYYDETLGKDTLLIATPGATAYELHWRTMLSDFARHLKQKGWFNKTTIAMDERPMEQMQIAFKIIKSSDKDFKVSMAGEYHVQIEAALFDYSVASKFVLPEEILKRRRRAGFITTYYTACPEAFPNTFTFSPPAESAFLGWYASAKGFDGYLRWAYNSWPPNPMHDSRFGQWSAGDTYFIYPGQRSSIRFERLIEGIQAYEKVRILSDEFKKNKQMNKLKQLKGLLENIQINKIRERGAAAMINNANNSLNDL